MKTKQIIALLSVLFLSRQVMAIGPPEITITQIHLKGNTACIAWEPIAGALTYEIKSTERTILKTSNGNGCFSKQNKRQGYELYAMNQQGKYIAFANLGAIFNE
jgi:hypothetical protein